MSHTLGFSAPTFIEKPKISSRDEGQILVMEFRCKSKSKPTIVWTKSDEIVAETDRIKLGFKDEGSQAYHCVMEIKVSKESEIFYIKLVWILFLFLGTDERKRCRSIHLHGKKWIRQADSNFHGEIWRWTFNLYLIQIWIHSLRSLLVPPGAPTFTRKPQILQKTAESGEPAIVFDIGFQADFQPNVVWLNPKGKKMKESSRIKFILSPEQTKNQYVGQLELKVINQRVKMRNAIWRG